MLKVRRFGFLSVVLPLLLLTPTVPAAAVTPLLPDLRMERLRDLSPDTTTWPGHRLLRFTAAIVNVGAGRFEMRARRRAPDTRFTVWQRIYTTAGGSSDVATPATLVYQGDGHDHWHVKDLESYALARLDQGRTGGRGAKRGFCFFDNEPFPRLAGRRGYTEAMACAPRKPRALEVLMGLSRGWEDVYQAKLVGQYIDVTHAAPGRYRLTATADPANWFRESNDANNVTWVTIWLQKTQVRILSSGPHP